VEVRIRDANLKMGVMILSTTTLSIFHSAWPLLIGNINVLSKDGVGGFFSHLSFLSKGIISFANVAGESVLLVIASRSINSLVVNP
jgi:hypothetical protein